MSPMSKYLICLLCLPLMFLSCTSVPENVSTVDVVPAIYPDYTSVTIPVGIAPLNFAMQDDSVTTVDVTVSGTKGETIHVNGDYADFPLDAWHSLVEQNRGGQLTVTVCAERNGQWTQYKSFPIYVSSYTLDDWGVTYRRIAPSYEIYSRMGIFQRDLSTFEERTLLQNTQSPGMCINCHTSGPQAELFHVRGEHGATVISSNGKVELLQARNDSLGGSMVYPAWHPGGRYVAFSTNKTSQMFHTQKTKRIEVYDSSSDVFIYDTQTHQILRDTLTMRLLWAENTPAFSADGRWLYYTTARRQVYPTAYDRECYSLCRVAFDEKTGRLGESVDTIAPPPTGDVQKDSIQKGSITWPRLSSDGRYLMFTRTDYGYFSIWHPEADLWLLDLQTMKSRPLDEVNSPRSDSFHNWSHDGHWFLFTSRRDDGLYTRLYFSAIGPDGRATKPFLLPQRNPKRYYSLSMYSYNTPEFITAPLHFDARDMGRRIDAAERVPTTTRNMYGQ